MFPLCQLSTQLIPRIAKDDEVTQETSLPPQHFLQGQDRAIVGYFRQKAMSWDKKLDIF